MQWGSGWMDGRVNRLEELSHTTLDIHTKWQWETVFEHEFRSSNVSGPAFRYRLSHMAQP
jgi:hypothetical protein